MKIILMSDGQFPAELRDRVHDMRSRTDKDLIALIEKRLDDVAGSREDLRKLYFADLHINEGHEIGKRVAQSVTDVINREIDKELGRYNVFYVETVPDEAEHVSIFDDSEGVEHVVYMVDGILYLDGYVLPNLLKELKDGNDCE